jgi:hypothetical protein
MLFVRAPICLPLCACAGEKGEKGGADSSEDKETPEIGSDGRSDGIGVNPDDVSTPLGSKSAGAADPGPGPWTPNFMGEFLKKSFQEALEKQSRQNEQIPSDRLGDGTSNSWACQPGPTGGLQFGEVAPLKIHRIPPPPEFIVPST